MTPSTIGFDTKPLKRIAGLRVSNVDKKSVDGETPVRLCNYTDVYYADTITPEMDFMVATATANEISKFRLRVGDVLITKDSEDYLDIGVPAYVAAQAPDLICGYHLAMLRPDQTLVHPRFLFWAMASSSVSHQLSVAATGLTRYGLRQDSIASAAIPYPPLLVQVAIADFLDRETVRIDQHIAKKKRLIELLKEKQRTLITQTATQGLDPDVPKRHVDDPWIRELPEHWILSKLTRVVEIAEGQIDPKLEPYASMPLIAPNHVSSGISVVSEVASAADQGAISGKYLCRPGDVIYSKIRPALRKVTLARSTCLCSADMYPMRPRAGLDAGFLMWWLLAEPFSVWAELESERVAMPKINRESLTRVKMPIPPIAEQRAIAACISQEVNAIADLTKADRETAG